MLIDGRFGYFIQNIPSNMSNILQSHACGINHHWKSSATLILVLETSLTNKFDSAAARRLRFFQIVLRQAYKVGIKRHNHQHFVRNGLASAVVSRTADQHGSGLGFKQCPFAGQPPHVMKSIIYRNVQSFSKHGIIPRVH
jgi:hypothetical protein